MLMQTRFSSFKLNVYNAIDVYREHLDAHITSHKKWCQWIYSTMFFVSYIFKENRKITSSVKKKNEPETLIILACLASWFWFCSLSLHNLLYLATHQPVIYRYAVNQPQTKTRRISRRRRRAAKALDLLFYNPLHNVCATLCLQASLEKKTLIAAVLWAEENESPGFKRSPKICWRSFNRVPQHSQMAVFHVFRLFLFGLSYG